MPATRPMSKDYPQGDPDRDREQREMEGYGGDLREHRISSGRACDGAGSPDRRSEMRWSLGVAQTRQSSFDFGDLWLEIGVGVLPEVDERAVVNGRLPDLAFGLVQLAESSPHERQYGAVRRRIDAPVVRRR